jgi:putative cell wall-binding protein
VASQKRRRKVRQNRPDYSEKWSKKWGFGATSRAKTNKKSDPVARAAVLVGLVALIGSIVTITVLLVVRQLPRSQAAVPDFATLYKAREDYTTAQGPTDVIHADLDANGIDEVLVSAAFDDAISVFASANGDGVYEEVAGSPFAVGGFSPNGITTGFFNADANLDVATANASSNDVSVLLGNGTTTLGAPTTFTSGSGPEAVRAGDFDGDSDADLIVANWNANQVAILLGNGAGSFGAPSTIAVGSRPTDILLGFFDAGTVIDAAVINGLSNTISILLGNGSGSFVPAVPATYATGAGPFNGRLVDFNDDTLQDIIVANQNTNNVSLFSNDGDGTFTSLGTVAAGLAPLAVDMADMNNDGEIDMVTGDTDGSTISVMLNTGSLTFAAPVSYSDSTDTWGMFIDDINTDGLNDVVSTSQNGNVMSVYIGDGTGELYGGKSYEAGNGEVGTASGDFNQDGDIDFAIGNSFDDTISIFIGDGAGGFALLGTEPAGDFPQALVSGDLDGVNGPDLVVVNGFTNLVQVLIGDGTGGFAAPVGYTVGGVALPDPRNLALGDLDGVNGLDLAVVSTASTGRLTIRLNNGDGTFGAPTVYTGLGGPTSVVIGNADNLSGPDVIVGDAFSSVFRVMLNTGAGVLGPAVAYASGGTAPQVTGGDWNADGLIDVAVFNEISENAGISLNTGLGVFGAPTMHSGLGRVQHPVTMDIDGNGTLDVAAAQYEPLDALTVLVGDGSGGFSFGGFYGVGSNPRFPLIIDLRNIGLPDAITTNAAENFTVLQNISGTPCVQLDPAIATITLNEGDSSSVSVVLGSQPNHDVTVTVASDPSVSTSPTSLRFTLGNWNIPQTLSVTAPDNTTVDGDQTVSVNLSAMSSDSIFSGCNAPTISVVVKDNDIAGTQSNVIRIPGATPQDIAINISKQSFSDGSAQAVVLARADNVVDALTITPLSGLTRADLLVTNPAGLEPAVRDELQRVLGSQIGTRKVYLAGGEVALTPQVETDLRAAGVNQIVRLGGAHRRETAQRIGEEIARQNAIAPTSIILTEDERFADALGVGAIAGANNNGSVIPILLSVRDSSTLDVTVDQFLDQHSSVRSIEIIGGAAALPLELATDIQQKHPGITLSRVEGATRFETNANFNELHATSPAIIVIANGEQGNLPGARSVEAASADTVGFFAALLAGNFAAGQSAPLLITSASSLPVAIDQYIQRHQATINTAYIVGSTQKVSQAIQDYLESLI